MFQRTELLNFPARVEPCSSLHYPPVPRKVHLWCIFLVLPAMNGSSPAGAELKLRENTAGMQDAEATKYCFISIMLLFRHVTLHVTWNVIVINRLCCFLLICFKLMIQAQDDQLDMVGHSVGVLKTMGKRIGDEIEEQNL